MNDKEGMHYLHKLHHFPAYIKTESFVSEQNGWK